MQVHERVCVDWSCSSDLVASFGRQVFVASQPSLQGDISQVPLLPRLTKVDGVVWQVMYERAQSGRVGKGWSGQEESQNDPCAPSFNAAGWAWAWLDRVKAAQVPPRYHFPKPSFAFSLPHARRLAGAAEIMARAKTESSAEYQSISSETVPKTTPPLPVTSSADPGKRIFGYVHKLLQMYKSKERSLIRRLCGWEGGGGKRATPRSALVSLALLDFRSAVQVRFHFQ